MLTHTRKMNRHDTRTRGTRKIRSKVPSSLVPSQRRRSRASLPVKLREGDRKERKETQRARGEGERKRGDGERKRKRAKTQIQNVGVKGRGGVRRVPHLEEHGGEQVDGGGAGGNLDEVGGGGSGEEVSDGGQRGGGAAGGVDDEGGRLAEGALSGLDVDALGVTYESAPQTIKNFGACAAFFWQRPIKTGFFFFTSSASCSIIQTHFSISIASANRDTIRISTVRRPRRRHKV